MSKDLLKKYEKDPNFKKEVDENLERYLTLEQAAAYSDLSAIPQGILKHIKSRNLYFYFGFQQPVSRKFLPKLAMYMAKNFQPQYIFDDIGQNKLIGLSFSMSFALIITYSGISGRYLLH